MIEFKNISKEFQLKRNKIHALNNVSLTIEDGDIYGIVGFSGAGKSTLLRMINGLEKPDSGQVTVDGKELGKLNKRDLRSLRKNIGMVFQQFNLLNSKTVYDNVAMPLVLNKTDKSDIEKRVKEMLDFVELSDKIHAYPDQLSGGQKQRVGIARALAMNPSILLCDEATSALDPKTTDSILELLKRIRNSLNITIVIITHEMHVIGKICNKVAVMENGSVVETGSVKEVFGNPKETITKGFVNMIVKEEVPHRTLEELMYQRGEDQLWSIKYWGVNQTLPIIKTLRETLKCEVTIAYTSSNILQEYTLNILVVIIRHAPAKKLSPGYANDRALSAGIEEALKPYEAVLERKE